MQSGQNNPQPSQSQPTGGGNSQPQKDPKGQPQPQANGSDPILPAANQQIAQDLPQPAADVPDLGVRAPLEAGDNDVIEKEWVEKAKEIVDKTRDNPYQQQAELSKMKTQYLKKRYNRDVNSLEQ